MKKNPDPDQLDSEAAKHEAIAHQLRLAAQKARHGDVPISPRTKLPVSDQESQAVERIHAEMQTSIFQHPDAQKSSE